MRKIVTLFLALFCFLTVKAQITLVDEGFEIIPHSFTSSFTGSVPDWDTTRVLKASGLNSLRMKTLLKKEASITTKKFTTLGQSKVYLRFKHICKLGVSDKAKLYYRTGGSSATWKVFPIADTVYLTPIYNPDLGYTANGFKASSYTEWLFNDTMVVPTESWWRTELFDVSSFVSNKDTVEFQFRNDRGNGNIAAGMTNYGWLIDDVQVIASLNEIVPPAIAQQPIIYQDTIYGIGPWNISAKVTDVSGVSTVNLVYTLERNGVQIGSFSEPMVAGPNNMYAYEIPSQPYRTKISYYIFAQDAFGNDDQSPQRWFFNKKQPALITVASDTTALSTMPNPFYQSYSQAKTQFIIKASELQALGLTPGDINSIAFYVKTASPATSAGSLFKNFIIKMAHTTLNATTAVFATPTFTTVYTAANLIGNHTVGWNTFAFPSAFSWDGTSNIMVETCFNNYNGTVSDYSSSATILQSTMSYNASTSAYTDTSVPDLCSAGATSIAANTKRPALKFGYTKASLPRDVAMVSIVAPPSTLITSTLSDVVVKIKTYGSEDLTSVRINWTLDGVLQPLYNWTGLLTQDQTSLDITIATGVEFSPGSHTVNVWVSDPNNNVDPNLENDNLQISVFSCGGVLAAGTYTVGGTSPDFATLEDVSLKLKVCGISGPVTFNVRPGTYYTNVNFGKTLGGSAVNTVTLKSESNNAASVVVLDTTNSSATFLLDTVSDFRVQYLTLKKTSNQNSKLVWFRGKTTNVQFTNNVFVGLDTNVTSDSYALVYSSKGATGKDSAIVFTDNTFKNGSIGLYLAATISNPSSDIVIQDNNFENQSYKGLHMFYMNKYNVVNNTIRQSLNSTQSFIGLFVSYCKGGTSISANKVYSTKLNCGLYLNYSKGNPLLVSNNFFAASTVVATSGVITYACGMYVYSSDSVNVFNNTVNLNGLDSVDSRAIYVTLGTVLDIRNNNFANNIRGFAYFVNIASPTLVSNYNNLYSSGAFVGSYAGTLTANIAAWKTRSAKDTNSVSVNPSFITWDNFHIFEAGLNGKAQPLASVPTDIENQVRDASTPDIGCDEFDVASQDLGVVAVVDPVSTFSCGATGVTIVTRIKNYGLTEIDFATNNVTVSASTSGTLVQNFNVVLNSGTLASGSTMDVTVTALADFSAQGLYSIKSWTTFAGDTVSLNDTISANFDLRKIVTYPYDVDFSSDLNPSWSITQLSGSIAWQRIQSSILLPTIAPYYGNGMLYFPSNTASSTGASSRAITPTFDFTGINRPYLEFWMSQDKGAASFPKEGVIVRISPDGGATWNNDTLFAARYNVAYNTPGWKLHSKLLTSYANMTCVKIAFDGVSFAGNNIGIDRVVVRELLDNDLKMTAVYAKGKLPIQGGLPDTLSAVIENIGALTQYSKAVTFDISGANTQMLTYTIDSIEPFTSKTIKIGGLAPTVVGVNTLIVSVPSDGNNSNNSKRWKLETTTNTFSYADTSAVTTKAGIGNGLLLAKYRVSGSHIVNNVKAYITGGSSLNKVVYGVLCNSSGAVISRTENYTILSGDTSRWVTFPFLDWTQTIVVDTTFYVGIAQVGSGYYPLGSQFETPVRGNSFYTSPSINGGAVQATTAQGRFMISTEIGELPAYEVALKSITNPVSGCGVGIQPVTLVIKNFGLNNIAANEITANYSVNGGTPISVPVNIAIASNTQTEFSFVPANFSAITTNVTYSIKAWVSHPLDIIHYNDTIFNYQVLSRPMPAPPTITSENPAIVSWNTPAIITAENPTGFSGIIDWFKTNLGVNKIGTGETFVSGNLKADTNFFAGFSAVEGQGMNTLGTGIVSSLYVPFYYFYNYGWSTSIYKRSEIQYTSTIDTLWVEVNTVITPGVINSQKVYLSTTTDSTFANTNYINPSGMTLVYNGDISILAPGWLAIPLTTPYNYTGNGNLLLHWENMDGTYSGNPNLTFKSTTMANMAKYKYIDASFPAEAGTMTASRTNIKFKGATYGCVSNRVNVAVTINNIPTVEVQPLAVTAPTSGCGLHQESIMVTVKNNLPTVAPAGTFIYYQINGGTPVADTIEVAINVGQTIPFTFSQKYDFSAPTVNTPFAIKVWTSATGDTYMINDTIKYNLESKWTASDIGLTDVTIPYGTSYSFIYPDWLKVYSNAAATNEISFAQNFNTPILYDTVSYWMRAIQVASAPINVQVGTSALTNSYAPFYYLYHYSWSSVIYKQSEFSNFGTIDTVWFNVSSNSATGIILNQKMYLKITSDSVFSSGSQPDRNTMTLVYDGSLNVPASGWIGIPLLAPFNYSGGGNLMMFWENRDGLWTDNPKPVWTSSSATNSVIYKFQDAGFPEGLAGTLSSSRPNARFTGKNMSCPSPIKQITVSVSDVPAQDAGVIRYNGPLGGNYLTLAEHIKVTVKNYGTDPITNFPVSYIIGNGAPVTEIYSGTLNSLDTAQFVFATDQDLNSFLNPLTIKAFTNLTGDNYASNDTITGTIAVPTYCTSNATTPASDQDIGNVTFAGINNGIAYPLYNNTTAVNGYSNFSLSLAPVYVAKGATYPISVTQINKLATAKKGKVKVYIDLNRNGIFDANETVFAANSTSATGSNLTWAQLTASGNITIPIAAQSGVTRMRVVLDDASASLACGTYTLGETEDYSVIIYAATDPDAALTNFKLPDNPTKVEGNIQPVKVNLLNVGTNPITAATITVIHNGVETTKAWTGNLLTMTSVIDSITSVILVAGVNNFTAFVDLTGDNMRFNDTIRFVLNALPRFDVKPVSVLNPTAMNCPNLNETIKVKITNAGQDTLFFASNNLVVKAQVLLNNIAEYQTTLSSGFLIANGTMDVDFVGADFSSGGAYRIKVIVSLMDDGNLANDTLLSDTITIATPAVAIPSLENFESFTINTYNYPNGWTSTSTTTLSNKYQWVANSGPTLSGAASGPAVDHTLGNPTGKYAYVYGGNGSANDMTSLTSRCYKFAGAPGQSNGLSFWYHMFNPGTKAKIYVEYGSGSNWLRVDSLVGQQQNTQAAPWLKKSITLPNDTKNARIRFIANKGTTPGDIAIDDINLTKMLPDVGVTAIVEPASYPDDSVMVNSYRQVKVLIHNFGQLSLDTVPVAFKLGTEAEVEERYIGLIAPGADVEYTFIATYKVPTPRMHYICAYTKLALDADETNNRKCRNVTAFPDTTHGFNDFDVAQFTLSQNVPNPAADKAIISFNMPQTGIVMFKVTDVLGRDLYTEELHANNGSNSIELNTVNFAPGIYYYWIEYKDKRLSKKMNIIR